MYRKLILLFALCSTMASPHATAQLTADQDFANRCAAPGVIECHGFEPSDFAVINPLCRSCTTEGLYPSIHDGVSVRIYPDNAYFVSGTSSARFDIPPYTGADAGGTFQYNFGNCGSDGPCQRFGPAGQPGATGSTFYIQYAVMMDSAFINTTWSASWKTDPKQMIIYDHRNLPCAQLSIVTDKAWDHPQDGMYTACGQYSVFTDPKDPTSYVTPRSDELIQQGASATRGYNCLFTNIVPGTGNGPGCFQFTPMKWYTMYYIIHVGAFGTPTSTIQAFVSVNRGPYLQWINCQNYTFHDDAGETTGTFNRIMLTPYMTGMRDTINHPSARVWYDELIISSQPIAAPQPLGTPNAGKLPGPPTNLRAGH